MVFRSQEKIDKQYRRLLIITEIIAYELCGKFCRLEAECTGTAIAEGIFLDLILLNDSEKYCQLVLKEILSTKLRGTHSLQ